MSKISESLGTLQHAESAVRSGFARAGVRESEVDVILDAFFAGNGKSTLEDAAYRFALNLLLKANSIVIELGNGWAFTVDQTIELDVDYGLFPQAITKAAELKTDDWEYYAKAPKVGDRKVKAVIGRLNRAWSEDKLASILDGSPLHFSGAWVREAFMKFRAKPDGKGAICFPDPATSRWRSRHGGRVVVFPRLCGDSGRPWVRDVSNVQREWLASCRLCLLYK